MRLKHYFFIALICIVLLIIWMTVSYSQAIKNPALEITQPGVLSWEGDLNPTDFKQWEVVQVLKRTNVYLWIVAKNPDEFSPIHFVLLIYDRIDYILREYRYWKGNTPYLLEYDKESDHYKRLDIPPSYKDRCFSCHKNKIKEEEV